MNKPTIYVSGEIGIETKLLDVIRQYKSFENPLELQVMVDSIGGSVSEGQAIFNYLRNLQIPITTVAKQAYSIAASIWMAGDERLVEEGADRILIHLPWAEVAGRADALESVAKELRKIEDDFAKFYSIYTNIDEDSIRTMLKNETYLSAQEAVDMGFATGIVTALKAVAVLNKEEIKPQVDNNNSKNKFMTKTEKWYETLNALVSKLTGLVSEDVEIKALLVQDANGVEIDFVDLAEGEEPAVGSKANVDGNPAEGEYVMPSGDTYVFVAGELTEIKPEEVVEETPAEEAPVEEALVEEAVAEEVVNPLAEELEALKAEILAKENTINEVKAELVAVKKLIGSEEVVITAQEPKTNQKSVTNALTNMLRGN